MKNFRWGYVVIAAAIGLTVKLLVSQSAKQQESAQTRPQSLQEQWMNDLGYHEPTRFRTVKIQSEAAHRSARETTVQPPARTKESVPPPAKAAAKTAAKKKKDDKKKVKRIVKTKKDIPDAEADETENDLSEEDGPAVADYQSPLDSYVAAFPANNERVNTKNPKTLEDWLAVLMPNPTLSQVDRLIAAFRSQTVSKDVYLDVARELLKDPRDRANEGGVRLIGSFPSAESFILLAEVLKSDFNRQVLRLAELYANEYQRLQHLPVLSQVIGLSDLHKDIRALALQKAEMAARTAEQNGSLILTTHPQTGAFTHGSARTLNEFGRSLESQSRQERDLDLRRRMSDLLAHLRQVLPT